jgi:hypothetical protein
MNWLRQLFSRRRLYRESSEEIQAHLDEKVEELVAEAMSREEAMWSARREFGNVGLIEDNCREIWGWTLVEDVFRGHPLWAALTVPQSGIYGRRVVDDRDWNRSQRSGLQCRK